MTVFRRTLCTLVAKTRAAIRRGCRRGEYSQRPDDSGNRPSDITEWAAAAIVAGMFVGIIAIVVKILDSITLYG